MVGNPCSNTWLAWVSSSCRARASTAVILGMATTVLILALGTGCGTTLAWRGTCHTELWQQVVRACGEAASPRSEVNTTAGEGGRAFLCRREAGPARFALDLSGAGKTRPKSTVQLLSKRGTGRPTDPHNPSTPGQRSSRRGRRMAFPPARMAQAREGGALRMERTGVAGCRFGPPPVPARLRHVVRRALCGRR